MRRSIALAIAVAMVATALSACSSGSRRRAAPAASAITSITQAPGAGWTTPVTETSFSGSPPGPRAAMPMTTPMPGSTWAQQPPVMDTVPQPPVMSDPAPATPMPAEPTWTPPAPIEDAGSLPGGGPVDTPAPIDWPEAPAPADLPADPADAAGAVAGGFAKPGFQTFERDGRLWVFRDGSEDLAAFLEHGEPAKSVTSIGTGPGGMSMRSGDLETIKDYLAAP